jgi:serine/threonine protein phosphatase 1
LKPGTGRADVIYAVGDIHGRADLLAELHQMIETDRERIDPPGCALLLHLGDTIDRGPDNRDVIDRLMAGMPRFENVTLKGNHEAMLLDALEGSHGEAWDLWLQCGGSTTVRSFDLAPDDPSTRDALREALGEPRLSWLRALPLTHRAGDYVFVHAGIAPGVPLEKQNEKDLLWIRRRFLDSEDDHGVIVVHGHTPADEPELRINRINVDTGAGWGRSLTAVRLVTGEPPRFFQVG